MLELPKIADAEMEVMNVLWVQSPLSSKEIIDAVLEKKPWDRRTVKTLLNRLHNKGAIGFDKNGREYLYFPVVMEEECIKQETKSFVSKFKKRMFRPLLTAFLEQEKLSKKEIEELKKLLDKKGKE